MPVRSVVAGVSLGLRLRYVCAFMSVVFNGGLHEQLRNHSTTPRRLTATAPTPRIPTSPTSTTSTSTSSTSRRTSSTCSSFRHLRRPSTGAVFGFFVYLTQDKFDEHFTDKTLPASRPCQHRAGTSWCRDSWPPAETRRWRRSRRTS